MLSEYRTDCRSGKVFWILGTKMQKSKSTIFKRKTVPKWIAQNFVFGIQEWFYGLLNAVIENVDYGGDLCKAKIV